jgi:hippurate hydrolase
MPVINSIAARAEDLARWRRALHRMPELGFDLPRTSRFVVDRLREIGVDEIHEGIASTGVVALIRGRGEGPTVALRADMDALPIHEESGAEWASETPGAMHACGHDGHTAMLLGAARHLAETRGFPGRIALVFQPAEEAGGGAEVMVREGLMERFGIEEVYGIHNTPGLPEGEIATRAGPILAAVDTFRIDIEGVGGHGAMPHETRDPIAALLTLGGAIQTIPSRNLCGTDALVVSITQVAGGTADNVIPHAAWLGGTVRSFDAQVRDMVERRMGEIVHGIGAAMGVEARLRYERGYPATVNDPGRAEFAAGVAAELAERVSVARPEMGAEDFAYMLEARPGAYLFLGAGEGAGLHHPRYDFNDRIAPLGASLLARLAERALEARAA